MTPGHRISDARAQVYDFYDTYLEAYRTRDTVSLRLLIGTAVLYRLSDGAGAASTVLTGGDAAAHVCEELDRIPPGDVDFGLDVYAVGMRGGDEAVAVIEQWTDVQATRTTRLAVEVLRRSAAGGWTLAVSDSHEVTSGPE